MAYSGYGTCLVFHFASAYLLAVPWASPISASLILMRKTGRHVRFGHCLVRKGLGYVPSAPLCKRSARPNVKSCKTADEKSSLQFAVMEVGTPPSWMRLAPLLTLRGCEACEAKSLALTTWLVEAWDTARGDGHMESQNPRWVLKYTKGLAGSGSTRPGYVGSNRIDEIEPRHQMRIHPRWCCTVSIVDHR